MREKTSNIQYWFKLAAVVILLLASMVVSFGWPLNPVAMGFLAAGLWCAGSL